MQASNKKSDVAQALDGSALTRAAVVSPITRLFALLMPADLFRLAAVMEAYPTEAARTTTVREAPALFWDTLIAMRALDAEWGV
jgi:hypothetical protein